MGARHEEQLYCSVHQILRARLKSYEYSPFLHIMDATVYLALRWICINVQRLFSNEMY